MNLRTALLGFIADFASPTNSSKQAFIQAAHELIHAAYGDEAPLVVDSFAGGGSIPMEALRLGCDAFASDVNPVSSLILKVLLEDIPRGGEELAEEVVKVGAEISRTADKRLKQYYPAGQNGEFPVAYLWARTISCDHCGAELPLIRSFWLSKKPKKKRALRCVVSKTGKRPARLSFEVFEPKADSQVHSATVDRAKASCLACHLVTSPERVRLQLVNQQGGASPIFDEDGKRKAGARLLAVVIKHPGVSGREYRPAQELDYTAVWKAQRELKALGGNDDGTSIIPTEELSYDEIRRISVPLYGATKWHHLFTRRQCLSICTFQDVTKHTEMSVACRRLICLAQDKLVMVLSAHCRWKATGESLIDMFGRHAIGMVWDFAEGVPGFDEESMFSGWTEQFGRFIRNVEASYKPGQVVRADACHHPLSDGACDLWFTDPPYYDSIPYAHLSDCFYVWLRKAGIQELMSTEFSTSVTPKDNECVVDRPHSLSKSKKDATYFEKSIGIAASEGRRITADDGAGCVVFAHKTTEGWEALLSGIIDAGWRITASWPIATELASRLNARDNASLETSVHLICRPRSLQADVGEWADVLRELPLRVGDWIERLQVEGVRGADLVFACIGPAMEVFSRYRHVEDAEGREIPLGGDPTLNEPYRRGFLSYVWETVGRLALEQVLGTAEAKARNGAAGVLEEDARLTALFLWTKQATDTQFNSGDAEENDDDDSMDDAEEDDKPKKKKAGLLLIYDVALRFAQPLGIHLDKWEGRIIETKKGIVRLLPVGERSGQLFGEEDAVAMSHRIEQDVKASRNYSFAFMQDVAAPPEIKPRGRGKAKATGAATSEAPAPQMVTTLDRLHAAMLLQSSGQSNGLRALLKEEQQRGPDFLRLANSLSALYPKDSEEKRLLDAMLLAVPRG